MASFQNAWHHLPSADAAGIRAFSGSSSRGWLSQATARIAAAHSELATLRGNHAMQHHTPALPTGAASLVGAPANNHHPMSVA